MNVRLALVCAVAILASVAPIRADATDLKLEAKLMTAKDHIQRKQNDDAAVPELKLASLVFSGSVCTNIFFQLTSGGFVFRWCANRRTVSGISYEVQKDIFESAGSLTLKRKLLLDCQNASDFQTLPAQAQALCP
jgi:hypothetical protein